MFNFYLHVSNSLGVGMFQSFCRKNIITNFHIVFHKSALASQDLLKYSHVHGSYCIGGGQFSLLVAMSVRLRVCPFSINRWLRPNG